MNDNYNPLKMLPMVVLLIFVLAKGLCKEPHSKNIILEDEEDVIALIFDYSSLNVKCDYWGPYETIEFQWKKIKNNRWYTESPNKIISKSQWLGFKKLTYTDKGQYSCSINGIDGNGTFSEKRGFILGTKSYYEPDLKVKPIFALNLTENVPLLVNNPLHLICTFNSTSDTVYSWYKNNKLLIERKAIIDDSSYIDNEYNSKTLKLSDSGNYTCVVQNTIGSIKHTFAVKVYEDVNKIPFYNHYPQHLSLKSGDTARFFCKDLGSINEVKWLFLNLTNPIDIDIQNVDLKQFKMMEEESNVQVERLDSALTINNVKIHDAGWYICVITGMHKMLMGEAKLDVDKGKK